MTNTDFAFIEGRWRSRQSRLAEVLVGSDEWYEFDATLEARTYLDGNSTFDVLKAPERGIEGITLRLFSPSEQVWRIWWANAATDGHLDEPPVVGRFDGPIGTFEADDVWQGRPIRVRYQWRDTDTPAPRGELEGRVHAGSGLTARAAL
jgi:hypothetical protein